MRIMELLVLPYYKRIETQHLTHLCQVSNALLSVANITVRAN